MNRFWNWVGDQQMLSELQEAGKQIANYDDWARVMFDLSDKSMTAGRRLSAAYYAKMAIFFLKVSDPRVKPAFQRFSENVLAENGVTAEDTHQVPYQGKQLTAYRFTPEKVRGSIVVFGGYDSYIIEWLPMALALRGAGMNTVIFDGPGQGTALDAGIPMTPDWHLPVSAVLNHFELTDCTLMGFSLGGALVLRAAAYESRISRVIAMDICTDLFEALTRGFGATGLSVIAQNSEQMPAILVNAAATAVQESDLLTDWSIAQGEHVMGVTSAADVFRAWREYRTDDVSSLVKQDVLLMASGSTLRRRLADWAGAGVLPRVHSMLVGMLRGQPDVARDLIVDSCSVRAKRGGDLTGPNPTDRAKRGTKYHVAVNGDGLPVACAAAMAANVNETPLLERLFRTAFVVMARVRTAFADEVYDAESNRDLCRRSRAEPRIGQRGQPHGSGLGKRRWPVERTNAWLLENKRLGLRCDRLGHIVESLLQAACILLVAPRLTREF